MAKNLMIQGTMSNVGKSVITAGLCRILADDGYTVAPFKSQNMALNSYVTPEGGEIGRAQAMQAEAARTLPHTDMNPILLKPTGDRGSQIVLNGSVYGNMGAAEYFQRKKEFVPEIRAAYDRLAATHDYIVIEGAGSPVELNLKQDDIVNMGLAEILDAPVLLVGDIDRGGVFAQLVGTLNLLTEAERMRVAGLIVNGFRGDRSLFEDGRRMLAEVTGKPVLGVVPYLDDLVLPDEDSLAASLNRRAASAGVYDIAVLRLPRISNFTDFQPLLSDSTYAVRYVTDPDELRRGGSAPDLVILPGSKHTIADLAWLRKTGLADAVCAFANSGTLVMGICGGFQMLGQKVDDPEESESGGSADGLGLLPVSTTLTGNKCTETSDIDYEDLPKVWTAFSGSCVHGYEIHTGVTKHADGDKVRYAASGNVFGTYQHGFFDAASSRELLADVLAFATGKKAPEVSRTDYTDMKDASYDRLAAVLRSELDMDAIYALL